MNDKKHVVFLRGINVGGHHKVPMAELREEIKKLGYQEITTILNSGNIIFKSEKKPVANKISRQLEDRFGFPVPVVVAEADSVRDLLKNNPFKDEEITKDIRFYVSFLWKDQDSSIGLPWYAPDQSFKILAKRNGMLLSVLDLAASKTPKAMATLEDFYGTEITTRNWKTIERIGKKLI